MNSGMLGRCGLVAVIGWLTVSCATKPPPPSTDLDETAYLNHLRVLTGADFEGRKPGTRGEEKTVAYLAEQFKKLGLKPVIKDSYVQQVPLLEVTAVAPSLTLSGQSGARRVAAGKEMVLWSPLSQPDVRLQRSDLLFVGYGVVAPQYQWNDYAALDVRGKTVLVLMGDPGTGSKDPALFKGGAMTAYGRWEYKIEEAARQGAAGVLLIHDPAAFGIPWSTVQDVWSGAQFQLPHAQGSAAEPLIAGWLQQDVVRAIFNDAGLDFAAQASAAAHAGFKPVALRAKVDASLHNTVRPIDSANVVALLPGDHHKTEYVLYTANWDGLGAGFEGAVDNASGTAGLLTLAQSFVRTQPRPDRSIVFLATTAGIPDWLGAKYYAANPVLPLELTAAVIDVQNLLPGGHSRDVSIAAFGNSDLEESARAEALLQGRESGPDPFPELGQYYTSAAYVFAHAGVPALFAYSGIDNAARGPAWGRLQRQDFLANLDRQALDKFSPDWNVRGALDDLTLYYQVGMRVARSRRFPRWHPNSEFRAAHALDAAPPQ